MESHDESRVNLLVSKVTRTTLSHSFPCILFPNLPSIVVIVGKFIYPEYSYSSLFLPCYSYTISSLPRSYSTLQFSAFWLPYTPSLVLLNCRHSTYLYFPFFINWQPSFLTCPYYHDPSCHPRRLSTSLSQHFHSLPARLSFHRPRLPIEPSLLMPGPHCYINSQILPNP